MAEAKHSPLLSLASPLDQLHEIAGGVAVGFAFERDVEVGR